MAKKQYVGVLNTAANVVKQYIGVSNVARKIVKGYVGVNNVAQQFWGGGNAGWPIYEVADVKCIDIVSYGTTYSYSKVNVDIAYYSTFKMGSYVNPLFISTDPDAVTIHTTVGDRTTTYNGTITYNGSTWYYNTSWGVPVDETLPIESLVTPSECLLPDEYTSMQDAVEYFLANYIYSNDFADNYQIGQSYTLSYGSIEKTLRKIIGIFLFKNVSLKSNTSYSALLANIETIVTNVLNDIGSNKIVNFDIFSISGTIRLNYRYTNANIPSKQIIQKTGDNDYTCYEIQTSIDTDVAKFVYINQDGNISYRDGITQPINYLGVYLNSYSGTLMLSNIGLDL